LESAPGKSPLDKLRAAVDSFASASELRDYRDLTALVSRLLDPTAPDPVASLVEFLRRDGFPTDIRGLRLAIPNDFKDNRLRPTGKFVISVQRADNSTTTYNFRSVDEGTRDPANRVTVFAFTADAANLVLRPGDVVWAEVNLRDSAGAEWKLSWWANGIRSTIYQFDRLALPPRLHRADQKAEDGELTPSIALSLAPDRAWPNLPDLLPGSR
jgi:hypothetical protein